MTKTQAIKLARKHVSELYPFGENYRFSVYDKHRNAWCESWATDYWTAKANRSEALATMARQAIGYGDGDEYVEYDGGPWTDYI